MSHSVSTSLAEPSSIPPVAQPTSLSLGSLFRSHRGRILLTYFLFNVENVLRLAQPLVLGLAINGLLKSSYVGLIAFIAQHMLHMLISTVRRMYDTRAFTAIYTELATDLIVEQRKDAVPTSTVAARSALARGYVEFFEQYVPMVIRATYSVLGALLLLAWYDWVLIPYCVLLIGPALLLNMFYGRKTYLFSGRLHDQLENEVDVIRGGESNALRDHFDSVANWRVRLSDAEAINFSLMELFVLAVMVASLVHYCTTGSPAPGDIFAVFRYVLLFIMGLDSVPRVVGQLSRLRDIGQRVRRRGK